MFLHDLFSSHNNAHFSSNLKISKRRMETNEVNPASRSTFLSCTEHCAKAGDFPPTWCLKRCPVTPQSAGCSPWEGGLHSSTEVSWSKRNLAPDSLQSPSVWHWVRTEFSKDVCSDIAASLNNSEGLEYKTFNLFHCLREAKTPLWFLPLLFFSRLFLVPGTDSAWSHGPGHSL